MDPVNPVRLARLYEDVDWVERSRRAGRGDNKQDEYRPSKRSDEGAAENESGEDVFEPLDPQE